MMAEDAKDCTGVARQGGAVAVGEGVARRGMAWIGLPRTGLEWRSRSGVARSGAAMRGAHGSDGAAGSGQTRQGGSVVARRAKVWSVTEGLGKAVKDRPAMSRLGSHGSCGPARHGRTRNGLERRSTQGLARGAKARSGLAVLDRPGKARLGRERPGTRGGPRMTKRWSARGCCANARQPRDAATEV